MSPHHGQRFTPTMIRWLAGDDRIVDAVARAADARVRALTLELGRDGQGRVLRARDAAVPPASGAVADPLAAANALALAEQELASCFELRGMCALLREEYLAAVDDFSSALRIDDGLATALCNRGIALACLRNHRSAAQDFALALRRVYSDEPDAEALKLKLRCNLAWLQFCGTDGVASGTATDAAGGTQAPAAFLDALGVDLARIVPAAAPAPRGRQQRQSRGGGRNARSGSPAATAQPPAAQPAAVPGRSASLIATAAANAAVAAAAAVTAAEERNDAADAGDAIHAPARAAPDTAAAAAAALQRALAAFRTALHAAPATARAFVLRGRCLLALRLMPQAEADARAALASRGAEAEAWSLLGDTLLAAGRALEAEVRHCADRQWRACVRVCVGGECAFPVSHLTIA